MSSLQRPYSLLKPANNVANETNVQVITNPGLFDLDMLKGSGPLVIDWETTGLDMIDPDFRAVGLGFADKHYPHGVYLSVRNVNESFMKLLIKRLCARELIAHNVTYDAAVLERLCRDYGMPSTLSPDWPWHADTVSLYFHLSQHEWQGQRYSLKQAQIDVLGWETRGDVELDAWLTENGLKKGDMHRAPDEILGHYGCLDAQSTWQLYEHLVPQVKEFPDTWHFITQEEIKYHYRSIVEMRFVGIKIDKQRLELYQDSKSKEAELILAELQQDSEATPWIEARSDKYEMEFMESEPERLTKTGKTAVRWTKWEAKRLEFDRYAWLNFNSKQQLRELFYGYLYSHGPVQPVVGFQGEQRSDNAGRLLWKVSILGPNNTVIEHEWFSKTPEVPVSKELLPKLGPVGKALHSYNTINKLQGYVSSMLDSLRDGIHHGSLRPLGTMTGRCAGNSYNEVDGVVSKVNLQQLPKDRGYLECLIARPGNVFVDADVTSLEPVVLAELSQCPAYMTLYGPDAKANDIYLFVAANTAALGPRITKYGYDPNNPTPEAISITKKKSKSDRDIAKVFHLSSGYGAGAKKIFKTLKSQGVAITIDQAEEMFADYWKLFKRVTEYTKELASERADNGGWFLDGIGNPVTIGKWKEKDILNSCIQGTGHRILVKHIANVMKLRDERQIPFDMVMPDYHDELVVECAKGNESRVMSLFNDAERLTNKQLGGKVYFKIEPEVCKDFADFKCE